MLWEFKWKVLTNVTTPGLDLFLRGSHPRPTNLAALTWETMLSEFFRFVWEVSLSDDQLQSFPHSGWTVNQFRPQKIIQYRHRQACRLTLLWGKLFTSLSNLDISWLFYIFGNKTAFIFTNIPTNTSSWCYDNLRKDFCKEHLFDDDTSSLSAHLVVAFFTRRKNSSWREDGKTDLHLSLHLLYHQDWVQKSFCTRAKILIWN